MKNHLILFVLFSITISLTSCVNDEPISVEAKLDYSFFVAGHTYGKLGVNNAGLHPPFEAYYDTINAYPQIQFGVLTGDIVFTSTEQDWDEVELSLQQLNTPIHFAFGNHDIQWNRPLIENRYGQPYKAFQQENDLFIFLDSNLDDWNISGEQLDFLTNTLDSLGTQSEHIFVFVHHMIWWDNDNIFANARPNSTDQKADSVNFWSEIEPLLSTLDKPTFLFSGDGGVFAYAPSLTYYKDGNITYVTSGMGMEVEDNFIIVEVMDNEEVRLKVMGLNCAEGSDCMGDIEDYLPF